MYEVFTAQEPVQNLPEGATRRVRTIKRLQESLLGEPVYRADANRFNFRLAQFIQ